MALQHQKRLRVLHFVDSLRVGGKERQVVELVKGLRKTKDVEQLVVTMGQEQFYAPDIQGLDVPVRYLLRKVRWDPLVFVRLLKIIRSFKPHIVHTNSDMATFYGLPVTRLAGVKLVDGTIRNAFSGGGFRWTLHRLLLRWADARVANSHAGLASRGLSPDSKGTYVIHNGFDFDRLEGAKTNAAVQEPSHGGKKIIGMVAEFSDFKDYRTFLNAAAGILKKRDDVIFIAVGGGKNLEECKQLASAAASGIKFLGERRDVEAIVAGLSIGVLCTYTEGISNSVMEYMAAGKPVIVTDGGGSREIVTDGMNGYLVPPSEPEALMERIERLLDTPGLAGRMGKAGKEILLRRFSTKRLVEDTVRMYHEVLQ